MLRKADPSGVEKRRLCSDADLIRQVGDVGHWHSIRDDKPEQMNRILVASRKLLLHFSLDGRFACVVEAIDAPPLLPRRHVEEEVDAALVSGRDSPIPLQVENSNLYQTLI